MSANTCSSGGAMAVPAQIPFEECALDTVPWAVYSGWDPLQFGILSHCHVFVRSSVSWEVFAAFAQSVLMQLLLGSPFPCSSCICPYTSKLCRDRPSSPDIMFAVLLAQSPVALSPSHAPWWCCRCSSCANEVDANSRGGVTISRQYMASSQVARAHSA